MASPALRVIAERKNWKKEAECEVKEEYVEEDDEASKDNEPDTTPPAPSSPSASIEDDPNMTDQNKFSQLGKRRHHPLDGTASSSVLPLLQLEDPRHQGRTHQ